MWPDARAHKTILGQSRRMLPLPGKGRQALAITTKALAYVSYVRGRDQLHTRMRR